MDTNRLSTGLGGFRKNLRLALKAIGLNRETGKLIPAPSGIDLFEGLEITPAELAVFLDYRAYKSSQLLSTMTRMASVGFAVEMGMHEVNTELYTAESNIRSAKANPTNGDRQLDEAISALDRLSTSLSTLAIMKNDSARHTVTGTEVVDTVQSIYGRYFKQEKIKLEATKSFLAAAIHGNARNTLPPILNLIRNAAYWTRQSDRPRHIRLDATMEKMESPNFDGEGTIVQDALVISVSDSGPGVRPEDAGSIFSPFHSGRGSAGIGLYLTREHLEWSAQTVVLSPDPSSLGGAEFRIGPKRLLEPVPREPLDARILLAAAGQGIREMLEDGRHDEVARSHGGHYADLMCEALRIRIDGPMNRLDQEIMEMAAAVEVALNSIGEPKQGITP